MQVQFLIRIDCALLVVSVVLLGFGNYKPDYSELLPVHTSCYNKNNLQDNWDDEDEEKPSAPVKTEKKKPLKVRISTIMCQCL